MLVPIHHLHDENKDEWDEMGFGLMISFVLFLIILNDVPTI